VTIGERIVRGNREDEAETYDMAVTRDPDSVIISSLVFSIGF